MSGLELTQNDIELHVVTFGADVYPPIDIPQEGTRLNMFFEEAKNQWGDLFERLEVSDSVYRIWKDYRASDRKPVPVHPIPTFALTERGPVIALPLRLPKPIGNTKLKEGELADLFHGIHERFHSKLPTVQSLKVGMVRELVFQTGKTPANSVLRVAEEMSGARLVGGTLVSEYRDSKCNVVLTLRPLEAILATQLPVGQVVHQHAGFGLGVKLDVNNVELRPLKKADIDEVFERAVSLWPDVLLDYLNGSGSL